MENEVIVVGPDDLAATRDWCSRIPPLESAWKTRTKRRREVAHECMYGQGAVSEDPEVFRGQGVQRLTNRRVVRVVLK